jgi:hypothetical protein
MHTTTMHSIASARMLGHLFFQKGVLPLALDPLSERSNEVVARVCGSSSRPSSLLSSRASSGVCSVDLFECCDSAVRDERVDFCEAGRELGVRVEPHCASGDSMADKVKGNKEQPGP